MSLVNDKVTRLGLKMICTASNIRNFLAENDVSCDRRDNLMEIAQMLEEADYWLHEQKEYCDSLAHLMLTYKKDSEISRMNIEKLIG